MEPSPSDMSKPQNIQFLSQIESSRHHQKQVEKNNKLIKTLQNKGARIIDAASTSFPVDPPPNKYASINLVGKKADPNKMVNIRIQNPSTIPVDDEEEQKFLKIMKYQLT